MMVVMQFSFFLLSLKSDPWKVGTIYLLLKFVYFGSYLMLVWLSAHTPQMRNHRTNSYD